MDGSYRGQLDEDIQSHKGWDQLEEFGALINSRALERDELVTFLASTGCFFKEIPGGILALHAPAQAVPRPRSTDCA